MRKLLGPYLLGQHDCIDGRPHSEPFKSAEYNESYTLGYSEQYEKEQNDSEGKR